MTPDLLPRISLALFLCGSSFFVISWWLYSKVKAEVNIKLPDNEKFGILWAYPGKAANVKAQHRNFYPCSRVRISLTICVWLGTICEIGVMYLLLAHDVSPIAVDLLR